MNKDIIKWSWAVDGCYIYDTKTNERIADAAPWQGIGKKSIADDIVRANARLIAAAPELYAALETVSKNCRLEAVFPGPIIRKIMDALQKARGEQ